MKELRRFSARPWTQAEDDQLRSLAIAGASSRAIGVSHTASDEPKTVLSNLPKAAS
jgi:hypothetical protein